MQMGPFVMRTTSILASTYTNSVVKVVSDSPAYVQKCFIF